MLSGAPGNDTEHVPCPDQTANRYPPGHDAERVFKPDQRDADHENVYIANGISGNEAERVPGTGEHDWG